MMGKSRKAAAPYTYENVWPEEICPVCGRKFMRRCRKTEWGYYYNDSPMQLTSNLTLLCSGPCAKTYAEQRFMADVRSTLSTRMGQALKLMDQGMSRRDAARSAGLVGDGGLNAFMDLRWKELDWLRSHNWEVPA